MKCILTYSERFPAFVNNSASATIYQYCGNDVFDPNFTGTGGQPTYFDQLSALYNRYRVYASAIEVRFYNTTVAQTTYVDMVLVPVNQTLAGTSVQNAMTLPNAKFQTTNNVVTKTMTHARTTGEQLGVKDVEGADRLQAQVTASPAERWLWAIGARSYDDTTAATIGIDVRISYYCEFFDRQIQNQSFFENKSNGQTQNGESKAKIEAKTAGICKTNQNELKVDVDCLQDNGERLFERGDRIVQQRDTEPRLVQGRGIGLGTYVVVGPPTSTKSNGKSQSLK
jgi:hypothetical protein